MTAPVVLVFYWPAAPRAVTLADDVAAVVEGEFEGRSSSGLVDIDAAPQIAQAMQIPQVPLVLLVLDGRP